MSELKQIQRYYDDDYYSGTIPDVRVSRHLRRLARSLRLGPEQQILDVACGKGEWLVAASEQGALPAGIDLSSVAIGVCRTSLPDGEFHVGPAEELPFPDNRFDLVSCLGSLEHFVEPDRALREMLRVAKPDARFLILVPNDGFLLRRLGLYKGTRQTVAREMVLPLHDWQTLFSKAGLRIQRRWKDLHVMSLSWINVGPLLIRPVRALVALLLLVLPVPWQYQVYLLCVRTT
jgi:SAM-dependent methyltransferase